MKKIKFTIGLLLLTISTFAQAPEKLSYQAVIRNASDVIVANQMVGMQLTILQGAITGTAVYEETQTPTTNTNGLVSLEIGNGNVVSGTFNTIDWSNGPFFIKTETDISGGANYTITGTSQLQSVPYALYARTSGSASNASLSNCNCSSYIIPYMPYGDNASQIIYVSNLPASWYNDGSTDNASDISIEAVDDSGNFYNLGVVATVNAGSVKKIATIVKTALESNGFIAGKVAFRIVLSNPEHAFVYASYTAGTARGYVEVECVR